MMQDWPSPRAARAMSRAGNRSGAGMAEMSDVAPVTHDHISRLTCMTVVPPILSATMPRGTCAKAAKVLSGHHCLHESDMVICVSPRAQVNNTIV